MPNSRRVTSWRAASPHCMPAGQAAWLDASRIPDLEARFPAACALAGALDSMRAASRCRSSTAAHFHMGGIATDAAGAEFARRLVGLRRSRGHRPARRQSSREQLVAGRPGVRRAHRTGMEAEDAAHAARPARDCPPPDRERTRHLTHRRIAATGRRSSLGPIRSGASMAQAIRTLEEWKAGLARGRRSPAHCTSHASRRARAPRIARRALSPRPPGTGSGPARTQFLQAGAAALPRSLRGATQSGCVTPVSAARRPRPGHRDRTRRGSRQAGRHHDAGRRPGRHDDVSVHPQPRTGSASPASTSRSSFFRDFRSRQPQ